MSNPADKLVSKHCDIYKSDKTTGGVCVVYSHRKMAEGITARSLKMYYSWWTLCVLTQLKSCLTKMESILTCTFKDLRVLAVFSS